MAAKKTVERGYGQDHRALRAFWEPIVQAGQAWCHEVRCLKRTRWIKPGTEWDLAHLPDRSGWRGPAHAVCNRSEAGRRGNPRGVPKRARLRPWKPTRDW